MFIVVNVVVIVLTISLVDALTFDDTLKADETANKAKTNTIMACMVDIY